MFQELRQYKIREGKMDAWVEFMETVIIPFQVSKGMVITGSYRGETDDTLYVWTRRFENEADGNGSMTPSTTPIRGATRSRQPSAS